jgi:hypothetical protein
MKVAVKNGDFVRSMSLELPTIAKYTDLMKREPNSWYHTYINTYQSGLALN